MKKLFLILIFLIIVFPIFANEPYKLDINNLIVCPNGFSTVPPTNWNRFYDWDYDGFIKNPPSRNTQVVLIGVPLGGYRNEKGLFFYVYTKDSNHNGTFDDGLILIKVLNVTPRLQKNDLIVVYGLYAGLINVRWDKNSKPFPIPAFYVYGIYDLTMRMYWGD